ncbi:MAG: hypothetical protein RLZZ524_3124 [Pseudomonadota bacterium]|jgi:hypothetical protein
MTGEFRGKQLFAGRLFVGRLFGPARGQFGGGLGQRPDRTISTRRLREIDEEDQLLLVMTLAAGVGVLS